MIRAVETPLPEFFEFIRNGMSVKQNKDGVGLPITRIETIANGTIDESRVGYAGIQKGEASKWLLKKGDILFSHINSVDHIGKCALFNGEFDLVHGMNLLCFRPKSEQADPKYFKWLFRSASFRSQIMPFVNKAVNQASLSIGNLSGLRLKIPPLDEQQRIAAILDQADELRRKRQRATDRLNQLGQAIFHAMFGDPKSNPRNLPWVKLGTIADFYSGNSLPEGETFTGQSDGHLLLKVSDLNHDLNQQDIVCSANWSAVAGSRAGTCPPNSLIFPKRGGAIGTNKKRWLRRSAILDPNLMGVHPNETDLSMSFLNGWFQTFNLTDIASGSSVPQLNKQDLEPLEIALPPLIEQIEYARRMEVLGCTRQAFICAADHDTQLFSVLQHRAFQGEL